ncbi:MAG: LysR family transcriptional regulator [Alphaproteobacteria bacterium]|nr:LysR family transcriptional regulator [Alphaproteobacteria bacterium SS10]
MVNRLIDQIDWNDLRLISAMAETRQVSLAAKLLRIDPTTVTRRLRRLELDIGIKRVERIKGGIEFSTEGDDLVLAARQLERTMEDLLPNLDGQDQIEGTVRVSSLDFLFELMAPKLVPIMKANPGIHLELRESYENVSLDQREADIVLRFTETPSPGLFGRRLGYAKFSVFGAADQPDQQLGTSPWMSYMQPHAHSVHDRWINDIDPGAKIIARTTSIITQTAAINPGLAIGASSDAYIEYRTDLTNLRSLGHSFWISLWLLTHEELRHVPRIRVAMDMLTRATKHVLEANGNETAEPASQARGGQ